MVFVRDFAVFGKCGREFAVFGKYGREFAVIGRVCGI